MPKSNGRLKTAIRETKEHLQINDDPDANDEDALESLMQDCGDTGDGCTLTGTEYCDWECPFS